MRWSQAQATPHAIEPPPVRLTALLYMAAAAVLWAIVEGLGVLLDSEQHPVEVVWMRYTTHLAILLIAFGPRRGRDTIQTQRLPLQIGRGLLMVLMPACFLAAVYAAEPENALSIFWVTPLLSMLLAGWLLREKITSWRWLLAIGGWLGALLILRPDSAGTALALAPALGMAACMSAYLVMTRMLRDESTLTNLVFTAACVLVPLSALLPAFWQTPTLRGITIMSAIGAVGLATLYAIDRATDLAPVSVVAPMLYIQPLTMFSLAVIAEKSHAGRAAILGTALIVAMSAILIASTRRQPAATDIAITADQPARVQS